MGQPRFTYVPPGEEVIPESFKPEPAGCMKLLGLIGLVAGFLIALIVVIPVVSASRKPAPTYTPYPTYTPFPSATPTGTLRPSPTATATLSPTPVIVQAMGRRSTLTATASPTQSPTPTPTASCEGRHKVKSGQHLSWIAAHWWTTSRSIAAANNIQNVDLIYPGQVLTIPNRCIRTTTPTAQPEVKQ